MAEIHSEGMQAGFFRHIFFIVAINLIIKPVYVLIIDRGVQNQLGTATYGMYFALFNLSYLIYIVADLGIYQYHTRHVAAKRSSDVLQTSEIAGVKLWLSGVYLICLILLAFILGYSAVLPLVVLLGVYQILVSWVQFVRSQLNGNGLYRVDAWTSILDRSILIVTIGTILLIPAWRMQFSLMQFIGLLVLSGALTLWSGNRFLHAHAVPFQLKRVGPKDMLKVVKQTVPFAITVILMTLYTRIDGIMLERLLPDGAYQAGLYAASYRLLDAANMIAYLVATPLLPMYSRHLQSGEPVYPLYRDAFKLLWVISGITVLISILFAWPIMDLLYDEAVPSWSRVFAWLMPNFISGSIIYVAGTLITASGKLRSMNWAAGVSIFTNIVLNAILIPKFQAWGAVIATLITQGLMALTLVIIVQSRYRFPQLRLWLGGLALLSGWGVMGWMVQKGIGSWYWQFIVFLVLAVVTGALTGWLPLRSWLAEVQGRR